MTNRLTWFTFFAQSSQGLSGYQDFWLIDNPHDKTLHMTVYAQPLLPEPSHNLSSVHDVYHMKTRCWTFDWEAEQGLKAIAVWPEPMQLTLEVVLDGIQCPTRSLNMNPNDSKRLMVNACNEMPVVAINPRDFAVAWSSKRIQFHPRARQAMSVKLSWQLASKPWWWQQTGIHPDLSDRQQLYSNQSIAQGLMTGQLYLQAGARYDVEMSIGLDGEDCPIQTLSFWAGGERDDEHHLVDAIVDVMSCQNIRVW